MNFLKFKIWNPKKFAQRSLTLTPKNYEAEKSSSTCDLRECRAEIIRKNCVYDVCAIKPNTQPPCVVIIGAGMAGLSAAHRLIQCGISNFKILEATDRPGGRVKTCWLGDSTIELGPQWITGASVANNVYTLAAQEGLLKPPLKRVSETEGIFFTSDGRAIDFSLTRKARSLFGFLESKATNIFFSGDSTSNKTLGEYFDQLIKTEVKKLPEVERYDTARILYGLESNLRARLGDDLNNVSSSAFGSLHELPGGNVMIPLGMGGVMAPLIRDLPNGSLLYCKPVHSIRWGTAGPGNPRAVVRCCDGSDFPADYVLITVPLGVLKKMHSTLFCPALPATKTIAIEKLGFGYVDRIFLEHTNPFWSGNSGGFRLAWSPQELKEQDGWVVGVTSFERVPASNRILSVTVSGKAAKEMETKTNAQLVSDLTNLLRKFVGDASIPVPKEVMKSDWSVNKNFFGSFTFMGRESNVGHIHDLMEPLPGNCDDIPPILLFAGEHTTPKYYSTLHGARLSGIREANRIIALTKKLDGPPNKGPPCNPCS